MREKIYKIAILFVRWPGKIEKRGGKVLISLFLEGLLLEGKSMSMLKFFLLFRRVFEGMFKVKDNLGFHQYVDGGPILDVAVG
jgi:hypothetical protein